MLAALIKQERVRGKHRYWKGRSKIDFICSPKESKDKKKTPKQNIKTTKQTITFWNPLLQDSASKKT